MAYSAFDPVTTGFEQPTTMTPRGQRAAYGGEELREYVPQARAPTPTRFETQPGLGPGGVHLLQGGQLPPVEAGVMPGVIGLASQLGVPAAILSAAAAAAAGYAGYQALGGGEGGGLFGLNILGGDGLERGGLEFGGPGLAEPLAPYTEWHVGNKQFYYVKQYNPSGSFKNGKVAMYNRDSKAWKVWTLPKPHLAIIGKNMPRHQQLTRLKRNLSRHTADAKTILKVASPAYYAKMSGYHKHHKGR